MTTKPKKSTTPTAKNEWVTEELVLEWLTEFTEDELKAMRRLFAVKSTEDLAISLADFINSQSRKTITCSLVASAVDVMSMKLQEQTEKLMKLAKNAVNN